MIEVGFVAVLIVTGIIYYDLLKVTDKCERQESQIQAMGEWLKELDKGVTDLTSITTATNEDLNVVVTKMVDIATRINIEQEDSDEQSV